MLRLSLLQAHFSREFKELLSLVLLCSLQNGQVFSKLCKAKQFTAFFS